MPSRLRASLAVLTLTFAISIAGCGRYMKLDGQITRVRVVETGGDQNVLVVEFEAINNAKVGYIVREAEIEIPGNDSAITGDAISVRDAKVICQHSPELGNDCAEPLLTRETFAPGSTVKRLVAASFQLTAEELKNRKGLLLRVRELDRLETEFRETR